jgi:hypothetical protein
MDRTPHEKPPLHPMLHEAHETLEDALDEACASKPAEQETTGEMIRLEENLSVAAEAAKRAVSIRRRMRDEEERATEPVTSEEQDAESGGA